jgi:hypothetical protein
VGLALLWSGVTAVCWYAPILCLAVAGWLTCWLHATPLPRGVPAPLLRKEAGHSVESKYGGAQVTVTVHAERRSYET